jgi:hypothetical protein
VAFFANVGGFMKRPVKSKSWFGILGSLALGVTLAMTACGGDGDDGDDGDGSTGGNTTAGGGTGPATQGGTQAAGSTGSTQAGSTGGRSGATGGVPSGGGVAGRQQLPNLRKNTAPSAN